MKSKERLEILKSELEEFETERRFIIEHPESLLLKTWRDFIIPIILLILTTILAFYGKKYLGI